MQETDKAYLAGIIDGEGCVSLGKRGKYLTPTVQVGNTKKQLLDWLCGLYGGYIWFNKEKRTSNRKPYWMWSVAGERARTVLRDAYPYMKLKREQAEIVFSLKNHKKTGHRMTAEDFAENDELLRRVRQLNKRGKDPENLLMEVAA